MWQTSERYGTHTIKGTDSNTYTFNNDVWGGSPGPQTIWANSNNDWGVTSQQEFSTDSWVQSYPHIGWAGGKKLSQYQSIVGTSRAQGPGYEQSLQWETAYDLWLNASAPGADDGYEIMIWLDTANVQPGSEYKGQVSCYGRTYGVYQNPGGNGACTWFVRQGNGPSATTHIKALIKEALALKGTNYSGPPDPVVSTIEFGWEVWGTGGKPAKFTCSRYGLDFTWRA